MPGDLDSHLKQSRIFGSVNEGGDHRPERELGAQIDAAAMATTPTASASPSRIDLDRLQVADAAVALRNDPGLIPCSPSACITLCLSPIRLSRASPRSKARDYQPGGLLYCSSGDGSGRRCSDLG